MFDCNLKFWWWWWWCRDCYSEQTGNSSGIMRLNSPGGSTLQWGSAPDLSCLAHALVVWRRGVGIAKLRDSQYCPKNICTNRIHLNVAWCRSFYLHVFDDVWCIRQKREHSIATSQPLTAPHFIRNTVAIISSVLKLFLLNMVKIIISIFLTTFNARRRRVTSQTSKVNKIALYVRRENLLHFTQTHLAWRW